VVGRIHGDEFGPHRAAPLGVNAGGRHHTVVGALRTDLEHGSDGLIDLAGRIVGQRSGHRRNQIRHGEHPLHIVFR
jgi:hypothetical protein